MWLIGALLYFTDVVAYDALLAKMEKSGSVAAIRSKFPIVIPPPWTWRSRSIVVFQTFFFYATRADSCVFCSALRVAGHQSRTDNKPESYLHNLWRATRRFACLTSFTRSHGSM